MQSEYATCWIELVYQFTKCLGTCIQKCTDAYILSMHLCCAVRSEDVWVHTGTYSVFPKILLFHNVFSWHNKYSDRSMMQNSEQIISVRILKSENVGVAWKNEKKKMDAVILTLTFYQCQKVWIQYVLCFVSSDYLLIFIHSCIPENMFTQHIA